MPDQVEAFEAVPEAVESPVQWTCARCGNDDRRRVWVDPSRPSLDPRYALGWCDACGPARKGVKGISREVRPLIRSSLFDRDAFLERQRSEADAALLGRYRRGHALSKAEMAKVREIIERTDH